MQRSHPYYICAWKQLTVFRRPTRIFAWEALLSAGVCIVKRLASLPQEPSGAYLRSLAEPISGAWRSLYQEPDRAYIRSLGLTEPTSEAWQSLHQEPDRAYIRSLGLTEPTSEAWQSLHQEPGEPTSGAWRSLYQEPDGAYISLRLKISSFPVK